MQIHETELIPVDSKSDKRGRRIVSAQERARLIESYHQSGLTQEAFARREGIKYTTLVGWLYKNRKKPNKHADSKGVHFTELTLPAGNRVDSLEVCLPSGLVIRGSSARKMAELIRLLGGV